MNKLTHYFPPLAADLGGLLLFIFVTPFFIDAFSVSAGSNPIWMSLAFIIFCVSVGATKRLMPQGHSIDLMQYKTAITVVSVILVFFVVGGIIDTWGFLWSVPNMDNQVANEGEVTTYLLAPAPWLALGLIYTLIMTTVTEPTIPAGSPRHTITTLFALLGINFFITVMAAYWQVIVNRVEPAGFLGWFLLSLFAFALFFLPTRLYVYARNPRPAVYVSFLILLVYFAWAVVT